MYLNNGDVGHDIINGYGHQFTGGNVSVRKNQKSGELEYTVQISISDGNTTSSYTITIEREAEDDLD